MQAGKLRHRVVIQSVSEALDSYGQPALTWSTVTTVWGSVEPLTGNEAWKAKQINADVTHRVVIRHYDGLTPKHRLQHDSRTLEILSVRNFEERGIYDEVLCKESV